MFCNNFINKHTKKTSLIYSNQHCKNISTNYLHRNKRKSTSEWEMSWAKGTSCVAIKLSEMVHWRTINQFNMLFGCFMQKSDLDSTSFLHASDESAACFQLEKVETYEHDKWSWTCLQHQLIFYVANCKTLMSINLSPHKTSSKNLVEVTKLTFSSSTWLVLIVLCKEDMKSLVRYKLSWSS